MERLLVIFSLLASALGFLPLSQRIHNSGAATSKNRASDSSPKFLSISHSSSSPALFSILGGVPQFEEWFASAGKTEQKAKHAEFQSNTLRGLEYSGKDKKNIIVLPEKLVLRTSYNRNKERRVEEDWDANLSVTLVKECIEGKDSHFYGYCSLLCQGKDFNSVSCPPSTAPNALRHWTSEQKARLRRSVDGDKLLKLAKRQMNRWTSKYEALPEEDKEVMTEDQFLWAMEAVNSRAFKGNYGGGVVNKLQSLALPFLAAICGLIFLFAYDDATADLIAQFCSLLVVGPAVLGLAEESKSPDQTEADAVLLPLIDSANHLEEAKSIIDYNPVNREFTLEIGSNCQVEEENGKTQLFVSYGLKTDRELLLNYGFLPGETGVTVEDEAGEDMLRDAQRKELAEIFVRQNPNL